GGLEVAAARNFDRADVKKPAFKVSRSVIEKAVATGRPVLVRDAVADPELSSRSSVAKHRLRSVVCIPFPRGARCLYLDNRFAEGAFGEAALPALATFTAHAAVAVENARLHAEAARKQDELDGARARAEELSRRLEEALERTKGELAVARVETRSV